MKGDYGLVLSGGGGKGSYFIGVWKAMIEFGLDKYIGAVSGTSIGALNGALFLQGDYKLAEKIWINVTKDEIFDFEPKKVITDLFHFGLTTKSIAKATKEFDIRDDFGIFSRQGLMKIIDENLDLKEIAKSQTDLFAACCKIPSLKTEYFRIYDSIEERIKKILLASSALPFIYPTVEIDGDEYIDGGVFDNVPITPLYKLGYRNFIIVYLGKFKPVDREKFLGINLIEVYPDKDLGNVVTSILDLSLETTEVRVNQGYDDAKIVFSAYESNVISEIEIIG